MRILVTGASGFVGGSFMRRYAHDKNVSLFGVSRRPTSLAHYAQVDLAETAEIPFAADVVIHAAARASPWGTPVEFERQNVEATRNVLHYCAAQGFPKLIYLSSSSVFYRHEHQFDLTELSPIGPRFVNEYARTKYEGERLVRAYPGTHVILRPRAVFGPGDTVLFPRILRAARMGRLPILTQAGPPARGDLIYIDSLCDYLFAACLRDSVNGDYNLTNAEPVVIQDFVLQALAALGMPAPTRRINVRTALLAADLTEAGYRLLHLRSEPPVTRFGVSVFAYSKTFDVSKALRDLGPPSVALTEGTARFIRWQRAQM